MFWYIADAVVSAVFVFYLFVDTCDGNAKILANSNRLCPISVEKFCGFLSLCHKNARQNFPSQPHFNC